ncbi:glycosyltransferase family 4 protein [Sulfitobacter pontiacus]|uniref:glycosyltransferase family 4 protein n=1 Tax=Sulfitobacter pontiacus TaxID=60137 RepID=UPI0030EC5469
MKVALITDSYAPLNNSAAVHMQDLASEMIAQGHSVLVLAPDPTLTAPYMVERSGELTVLRARTMDMRKGGNVKRAFAELALSPSLAWRMFQSRISKQPLDAVIWYSPSIFWGPLVKYLRVSKRVKTYLILRDVFPEWAIDVGVMRRGIAYQIFKVFEKFQYRQADVIAIQSEKTRPYLHKMLKDETPKIEFLLCWLRDLNKKPYYDLSLPESLQGKKVCIYTGNMGVAQDTGVFLDLAKMTLDRPDIKYLFVGRGTDVASLKQRITDEGISNAIFQDEVDSDVLPDLLAQADVGLVSLELSHKTDNVPGKFVGYTRNALPVLASMNTDNDLTHAINSSQIGFATDTRDLDFLKRSLLDLLDTPNAASRTSKNARRYFKENFRSDEAVHKIITTLQDI